MTGAKANSLRTQQAIARFGKAARHPLCLAALDLWRWDEELSKSTKDIVATEEVLNRAKRLRKIDKLLLNVQKRYETLVKLRSKYELRGWLVAQFEHEKDAALRAGDSKADRALQRLRKRWSANEARLKDGNYRTLEMLNMLRDKVIKAAWAKDGGIAGHLEAVRSAYRALSDEAWEGRLTAREIHSHIVAARGFRVAADKNAKEVRRLARKLGIRLAEDQRGRKRKPYMAKQGPMRPHGRPRSKPDICFTDNLEVVEANKVATAKGKIPVRGADY